MYDVYVKSTKQLQGDTTVRLPRKLVEEVRVIANAHERSLSAELRVALREYVKGNVESTGSKRPRRA